MKDLEAQKEPFCLKAFKNVKSVVMTQSNLCRNKKETVESSIGTNSQVKSGTRLVHAPSNRRRSTSQAHSTILLGQADLTEVCKSPRMNSISISRPDNLSDHEEMAFLSDQDDDIETKNNRFELVKRVVGNSNNSDSEVRPFESCVAVHPASPSPIIIKKKNNLNNSSNTTETTTPKLPPISNKGVRRSMHSQSSGPATPTEGFSTQMNKTGQSFTSSTITEECEAGLHKSFGKIPSYLKNFKKQEEQKKKDEIAAKEAAKIPKGMRLLSEEEKKETIATLNFKKDQILEENRKLPLKIETIGQKQRQADINKRLIEVEAAIKAFNKEKVFVDLSS